eukprot:scaffold266116_cov18-Tisochrysis_lutea.AAC.3
MKACDPLVREQAQIVVTAASYQSNGAYSSRPSIALCTQEYRIFNCEILFKEDITVDDLIDIIEGNRKYVKCLYVYNK